MQIRAGVTKGMMCNAPPNGWHGQLPSAHIVVYPTLKTRICRQTYYELESTALFYQVNTFAFLELAELHKFLSTLTVHSRHNLRNIRIQYHLYKDYKVRTQSMERFHMPDKHREVAYITTLLSDCQQLQQLCLDVESQSFSDLNPSQTRSYARGQATRLFSRVVAIDTLGHGLYGDQEPWERVWPGDSLVYHLRQFRQFRLIAHFPCIRGGIDQDSEDPTLFHKDLKATIDLTGEPDRHGAEPLYEVNNRFYRFIQSQKFQERVRITREAVAKWKQDGMSKSTLAFPLPADRQAELEEASDNAWVPTPGYTRTNQAQKADENLPLPGALPSLDSRYPLGVRLMPS